MSDPKEPASVAENLIMMALALLDRTGHAETSCDLQHALDTLRGEQSMREGDKLTAEQIAMYDYLDQPAPRDWTNAAR